MLTVIDVLRRTAGRHPERPFLTWTRPDGQDETVTYRAALEHVTEVAAALARHRVGFGDRVAVVLPNGPELAFLWFACARLGAVLVPLDERLTDKELRALVTTAAPSLVLVPPHRKELADTLGPFRVVSELSGGGDPPDGPVSAQSPLVVLFTSGSTGKPKGCVLSQLSFVLPVEEFCERLGISHEDVVLHVLPLHHMAGLSLLASAAHRGAHVVLRPRFSGSRFWPEVRKYRATVFRHLGEMLAVLCARPADPDDLSTTLRVVYGGGAPAETARLFTARYGVPVVEGFGLSETNTLLCGRWDAPNPGTLGEPLDHVRIRLIDAVGATVHGPGTGRLLVRRNPAMMSGYFRAPAATRQAFTGHWFATGDLVRRDEAGMLTFAGRTDDLIRRRGENIDPAEIERVVEACAGVRRAVALGVPDPFGGQEIEVFLEPLPRFVVDRGLVEQACARALAPFKRPREIHIMHRLPVTATEKVARSALQRKAAAMAAKREVHNGHGFGSSVAERAEQLAKLADVVEDTAGELEDLAVELFPFSRKVIRSDIRLAITRLRAFPGALDALQGREPVGKVALCLPGNAILSNPVATIGASYLAGNRTLARLPGRRARWAEILADLLRPALSGRVEFSDRAGPVFLGESMADPGIGAVMAFGDDNWARGYEEPARKTGTRFVFEGPGKDPFLVLPGASVPEAAAAAVAAGLYNAGQACTAPERFYVHREIYPEFVGQVAELTAALAIGEHWDEATDIAPLDRATASRVLAQLDAATKAGAKLLYGGKAHNVGDRVLIEPAVLVDVGHDMDVMRAETFGPVLPIVQADSADEAVELAEDSVYGLTATVFGGTTDIAARLARTHGEVFTGETWLEHRRRLPLAPYGGRRRSGWVWEWHGGAFVRRDGPRLTLHEFGRPAG
ncbi:aldehyde dehydrogenase family protein [Amycolatopsis acidicola]|uniref:Aldehyde dehydrogenase family protein n=1 Tax=Amycolatopsis acidicola TaxID=2596893 RepID=A0A5N0V3S6_9PSEU|nr:aldehyde dehydrogenase family protein [Amycolatopsis acidicola]KAA9159616.1 aldehyde dehydrogenase family protein [Amycolatopsis acidicola]